MVSPTLMQANENVFARSYRIGFKRIGERHFRRQLHLTVIRILHGIDGLDRNQNRHRVGHL
jgi:hypothetical protein